MSAPNHHGTHEYSTFSASTIRLTTPFNEYRNKFHKYCCCLCRLSSSLLLHPVGPFRYIWDLSVMLLIIYTSIEIPFAIAFGQSSTTLYVSLCVDIFLLMDIFLNFHTAYFDKYDNLRLVTNKRYICKKYLRTWFLVDFVTCVPFEFATSRSLSYVKMLRIFRLLRIIKILRLFKMFRIFDTFMRQLISREALAFMKLFKIVCGMLMFAHFGACLWWFVGSNTSPSWIDATHLRDNEIETFTKYSYAWYWAVVTLFTTGYGDIVATNTSEQWICSICIILGTCFFAYFMGSLIVLITEGDNIKSYQSDKLEEAQSFCEKKKLPKELTHAILSHIRYHCRYNYVFDETELLNILPTYLQHDIHSCVSKQFLLQLKIFQNAYIQLPEFIIGLIAVKTKSISCNQSYKLYDVGDVAKEFYIQRTGKSTLSDKNGQVLHELSRGSVCGEYSSILFKKRKSKIECKTWSEFYSISIDDIKQILDLYYPKSSYSKWMQIKKYVKVACKKNVKHCVDLNQYNQCTMNLSSSLHSISSSAAPSRSLARHVTKSYDSSIHLFDNARNSQSTLPHLNRRASVVPYPPSPTSDTEEVDEEFNNDNNNKSETLSKKSRIQRIMSKFKIRTNSKVRNVVVVAHGEKHNQLSIPSPIPSYNVKAELKKYKSAPDSQELLNKSDRSLFVTETEMSTKIEHDNINIYDINKNELEAKKQSGSESDSECSFSSVAISTDLSYEDGNVECVPLVAMASDQDNSNNNPQKRYQNQKYFAQKTPKVPKQKPKKRKVLRKRKKGKLGVKFKAINTINRSQSNNSNCRLTIHGDKNINKREVGRVSSCESLVILTKYDSSTEDDIYFADSQNEEKEENMADNKVNHIITINIKEKSVDKLPDEQLFLQSIASGVSTDVMVKSGNDVIL